MTRTRSFVFLAVLAAAAVAITCGGPKGGGTTTGGTGGTGAGTGDGTADTGGSATTDGSATGGGTTTGGGPVTPRPANAVDVTLAEVGLEASSLDRSADPCVDFYQFTCGGWLAKNPIPADRARWGRLSELDEKNETALRAIAEEAAAGKLGTDPVSTKIGDYYAACMDEAAIEAKGTDGIKPVLALIGKTRNAKSWFKAVVELHKIGVGVVWNLGVEPDLKDSTRMALYLDSGGLGLPDRDYFFEDKFKDKLAFYTKHVAKMLELMGRPADQATTGAADVVAIETELARVTKTKTERRDIPKLYNPVDRKALKKTVASVDWNAYFKQLGFDPGKKIIITTPAFFKALDKLRKQFTAAQWRSYFTFHVAQDLAFTLTKKIDDQAFELAKQLTGVESQRARYKRCVDAVDQAMPELFGQPFVTRAFPGESKAAAEQMVDSIATAIGEDIDSLAWMSDATKPAARAKLAKLEKLIGFPDKWKTYDYEVKRPDFAGNVLRSRAFDLKRNRKKAGKPHDRGEWLMPAYLVNAYYNPSANNTGLPAGILQPPMFGIDRGVAVNMGGLGMVIGHELTHGFDDQGAQFDENGNLKNWWSKDDEERFKARGKCVAEQYATFEALPKQFVNGELTLGENIADLGGVKNAFRAYRNLRKAADKVYVAEGYSEDQQFFIAVGQAWCNKDRKEETLRRLTVDPHSPPRFRVYGALRNLPDFAKAFSCAAGTPMAPANRCEVW
jgi:putative endopeptidase